MTFTVLNVVLTTLESKASPWNAIPALFIKTSTFLYFYLTLSTKLFMLSLLETSNSSTEILALGNFFKIYKRLFIASSRFLQAMIISQPCFRARFSTIPYPIPLLLPVTMIVLRFYIKDLLFQF